jgi:hypothetical protein
MIHRVVENVELSFPAEVDHFLHLPLVSVLLEVTRSEQVDLFHH